MYEVVGCPGCRALWIREGDAETAECPRCGRTHAVDDLRALAETESASAARDARTELLAERAGHDTDAVADFSSLEEATAEPAVDDGAYARANDLASDALDGDPADSGAREPRDIVMAAIADCEKPRRKDIVDYAGTFDLSPEATHELLDRLIDAGLAIQDDGIYRLVE